MTEPWQGLRLEEEQAAVVELVDDLAANRFARTGDSDAEAVASARAVVVDHGLWTLGVPEEDGGGGADLRTSLLAFRRLGAAWPALSWASVQAHAAATVLAGAAKWSDLLDGVHQGAPVAVARTGAAERDAALVDGRLVGEVARIDPAGSDAHVVLLLDDSTAVVLAPGDVQARPLRRTGLDGAMTAAVRVDLDVDDGAVVRGPHVGAARRMLLLGGAAVAAGIAEAAAQAAIAYSSERVQFGAPLTRLPTVRTTLMRQVAAARSALLTACESGPDRLVEAASALSHACDVAVDVGAAAVQAHGGYGYMAEYPVEGMLRDAVSLRAATGTLSASSEAGRALVGEGA